MNYVTTHNARAADVCKNGLREFLAEHGLDWWTTRYDSVLLENADARKLIGLDGAGWGKHSYGWSNRHQRGTKGFGEGYGYGYGFGCDDAYYGYGHDLGGGWGNGRGTGDYTYGHAETSGNGRGAGTGYCRYLNPDSVTDGYGHGRQSYGCSRGDDGTDGYGDGTGHFVLQPPKPQE